VKQVRSKPREVIHGRAVCHRRRPPRLSWRTGAGDVKGLAALGTWLGLERTIYLFFYMGLSGGLIIIAVLIWQGRFCAQIRRSSIQFQNWVMCPSRLRGPDRVEARGLEIPYGAALALGMALLCGRQLWRS
jgi:Flp pilus assembly protein protease CpaA